MHEITHARIGCRISVVIVFAKFRDTHFLHIGLNISPEIDTVNIKKGSEFGCHLFPIFVIIGGGRQHTWISFPVLHVQGSKVKFPRRSEPGR